MVSLTRFDGENGIEVLINTETGEAFASVSGYARMSGKSVQTISKRLKGVNQNDLKTAEIETEGGLQGVNLIPAKLVFQWAIKDSPELAAKMGECGATVFLHQLAGYQVRSNESTEMTSMEMIAAIATRQAKAERHELAQDKEISLLKSKNELLLRQNELLRDQMLILESNQDEVRLQAQSNAAEIGRIKDADGLYYSIIGFGLLHNIKLTRQQAALLGQTATRYCKFHDLHKEFIQDSTFGKIGNYPVEALIYTFQNHGYCLDLNEAESM